MNPLDAAIVILLVGATVGGYQLGFAARLLAWAGVALGLAVGAQFVARVVTAFGGDQPDGRVTVAALFLLLCASAGQGVGLAISHALPRVARPRRAWDRWAGALLGAVGVVVLVWMLIPAFAVTKGWPARATRSSTVVRWIDEFAPRPPARFAALGRAVADAPYPSALGPLATPPDPGRPPALALSAAVDARVRPSTVEVQGEACGRIQAGSGWVAELASNAPVGALGSAAGIFPVRAKASNRIGAAAVRPTRPGTGAPSGRPTHTPIVIRPSKPTDQASR